MVHLVDALERMSKPVFWETIVKLHGQAVEYNREIDSLRKIARSNPGFARDQLTVVQQLRDAVNDGFYELLKDYTHAESIIRNDCPQFLGGLPAVDGLTLDTLRPAECAQMIKSTLGHYLQWQAKTPPILQPNDEELLQAMLELKLCPDKAASREVILQKAGWTTEGKRAFDRLVEYGYVVAKRGVGFCLTEEGIAKAKEVVART